MLSGWQLVQWLLGLAASAKWVYGEGQGTTTSGVGTASGSGAMTDEMTSTHNPEVRFSRHFVVLSWTNDLELASELGHISRNEREASSASCSVVCQSSTHIFYSTCVPGNKNVCMLISLLCCYIWSGDIENIRHLDCIQPFSDNRDL